MRLEKRRDGWWIVDESGGTDCGPYDTQAEARDDMRGMERFAKYAARPGYVTSDKRTH